MIVFFFITEKNIFEKKLEKKSEKMIFQLFKKSIFSSNNFTWKNRFSNWKKSKIFENFPRFFFKMIFLHDEKIFFDEIFLKVHLQVEENRFKAVSKRFQHFEDDLWHLLLFLPYLHKVFRYQRWVSIILWNCSLKRTLFFDRNRYEKFLLLLINTFKMFQDFCPKGLLCRSLKFWCASVCRRLSVVCRPQPQQGD